MKRLDYSAMTNLIRRRSDASIVVLGMDLFSPTSSHFHAVTWTSGSPEARNGRPSADDLGGEEEEVRNTHVKQKPKHANFSRARKNCDVH